MKLIKLVFFFYNFFDIFFCCILMLDFIFCKIYNEFLYLIMYMFLFFGEVIFKKCMNIDDYVCYYSDFELL